MAERALAQESPVDGRNNQNILVSSTFEYLFIFTYFMCLSVELTEAQEDDEDPETTCSFSFIIPN
jgi:hypothetical protein